MMRVVMSREDLVEAQKAILDEVIEIIDSYTNGFACCIALKNKILSEVEEKYEVKHGEK